MSERSRPCAAPPHTSRRNPGRPRPRPGKRRARGAASSVRGAAPLAGPAGVQAGNQRARCTSSSPRGGGLRVARMPSGPTSASSGSPGDITAAPEPGGPPRCRPGWRRPGRSARIGPGVVKFLRPSAPRSRRDQHGTWSAEAAAAAGCRSRVPRRRRCSRRRRSTTSAKSRLRAGSGHVRLVACLPTTYRCQPTASAVEASPRASRSSGEDHGVHPGPEAAVFTGNGQGEVAALPHGLGSPAKGKVRCRSCSAAVCANR